MLKTLTREPRLRSLALLLIRRALSWEVKTVAILEFMKLRETFLLTTWTLSRSTLSVLKSPMLLSPLIDSTSSSMLR